MFYSLKIEKAVLKKKLKDWNYSMQFYTDNITEKLLEVGTKVS